MKISKYIGDLIYDYECVVIPGLGGFISTEKSATVNPLTNQFSPPSKDVHFNIHLKANDGLLINYVARNEEISFKIAKQRVDKFVLSCHKALKEGKRINFSKIGYIYYDNQQNVVFKQDKTINYNADAFGLNSFVSPAIRRPNTEEKIKEAFTKKTNKSSQVVDSKKKKDRRVSSEASGLVMTARKGRPSKVKQQLAFVFVILFVMASYYGINRRHAMMYYWDAYKVYVPLLYNSPNDYLAANAGILPLEKISVSQAGWLSGIFDFNKNTSEQKEKSTTQVVEDTSELDDNVIDLTENNNKPIEEIDLKVSGDINTDEPIDFEDEKHDYYINPNSSESDSKVDTKEIIKKVESVMPIISNKIFIIAGSFKSERNALNLVSSLKRQGYEALIADTNTYGMYRVALMSFKNMLEAEQRLVAVKNDYNTQAWILRK